RTHPEDLPAVFDEATLQDLFTPDSAAVFSARTPEFTATTPPSIAKLVADEPRFSTFTKALNRTELDERLSVCTEGPDTLFAPTNDALDRYVAASGLDLDDVLNDAAWLETFLVDDLLALSGPTGLSDDAVELATWSGDIVTVTGGADPRVQGVPVLADIRDLAACNGALNGIDDIYSPND
ncbi:MAG: fasciclin domain-containing protein, partial [Acidimicrobiales bacterium]